MKDKKKTWGSTAFTCFMFLLAATVLFPVVYQIIAGFKNKTEINRPLSFPSEFYLGNFLEAVVDGRFLVLFRNSVVVTVLTLLVVILFGALAAYPLVRSEKRLYRILYLFFLSGIMVPFQAGMIPLYRLINGLHLIDTLLSLVLILSGTTLPMVILIYTGFIKSIPKELEEAARIDGCGMLKAFIRVVFPLLKPATVSAVILNIIPIWNDFLTPLIFISSEDKKTLPMGMYTFMGERTADMGPIFGFSVLSSIVPVILFLTMQKYFYKGLVDGAVKG